MPDDQTVTAATAPPSASQPGPPSAREIDGFLAWTLVRVGRAVERDLVESITAYELTPTQFGVLAHLASGDGFTQSDLARAVLVRPQSMNTLIGSLIERGLVARRGPGGRGRRDIVELTTDGARLIEQAWTDITDRHTPDRLGLDADQARTVDHLLQTVLTAGEQP